jgi:hypothetical protein
MKATRQEYIEDIKALEQTLTRFLVKHGRSGMMDLEILYAVESVMESGWVEPTDERTYEDNFVDLIERGFSVNESEEYYRHDLVYEEVRAGLLGAGLVKEVEA